MPGALTKGFRAAACPGAGRGWEGAAPAFPRLAAEGRPGPARPGWRDPQAPRRGPARLSGAGPSSAPAARRGLRAAPSAARRLREPARPGPAPWLPRRRRGPEPRCPRPRRAETSTGCAPSSPEVGAPGGDEVSLSPVEPPLGSPLGERGSRFAFFPYGPRRWRGARQGLARVSEAARSSGQPPVKCPRSSSPR